MAITIRNITDEQIELAKSESGYGTASRALVECVELAASRRRLMDDLYKRNDELKERIRHLESIQARLANAADEALTIIRQRELLR